MAKLNSKWWDNLIPRLHQPEGVDATILYPTMAAEAREARIALRDPVYGTGHTHVELRPVNLLRLEQLITAERKIKNERGRTAFARWLVFGGD